MSLSRARALTLLSFLRSRQNKRTVRPLVLGTLFLARSLGSRGALCNGKEAIYTCCREALSPLRPSI